MDVDDGAGLLWFWQSTCERGCTFDRSRDVPEADPRWPTVCEYDGSPLTHIPAAR